VGQAVIGANDPTDGAVVRLHELVVASVGRATPELAHAAHGMGQWLGESGRHEDALILIDDALVLFRELANTEAGLFQHSLARALVDRAVYLIEMGRLRAALDAGEEALAIYRNLASTHH
jgi:tetratricopeptide (TPR) repeat protein